MEEEIELSLELSLNGRFGVNTKSASNNNLIRSSSISNLLEIPKIPSENLPLTRTCSLPVESEEETRRRKEIQMLRRMEAKRKRSEKQRREIGSDGNGKFEISGNGVPKVGFTGHGFDSKPPGFGFGFGNGGDNNGILYPPFSRGSSASSSSGTSELESQTPPTTNQGMNKNTEAKSPQSVQSFTDQIEKRPSQSPGDPKRLKKTTTSVDTATMVNTHLNPSRSVSETNNIVTNMLTDMPCVSTKEEGPNGKRIEGFLYRYRKGEEVRIVCVCHGSFLTPAEFIKHAGGGDVEHPLRHIVVKPSPLL